MEIKKLQIRITFSSTSEDYVTNVIKEMNQQPLIIRNKIDTPNRSHSYCIYETIMTETDTPFPY